MTTRPIIYLVGAYPQWSETFVRQDLALLQELGLPLLPVALFPGDCERQGSWPEVNYLTGETEPGALEGPRPPNALSMVLPRFVATRLSLLRHGRRVRALMELARGADACHIHAEFADLPGLVAAAAARRLGISHSLSVHARDVHLAKFSPGSIYGGARFVMACNRDVWREANRYASAAQAGVHLIHHGIDFSDWHYQDKPAGAADESVRLLFVGRFVEKKGLDVLFRALARYREEGGSFELSLFGQGPLAEPMRHMVEALGLADFVSWHDVVSREQIAREMHRHDALVMPSVRSHEGDRDGIPNVVVEAMACGLPVIGSDAGSLPDVLSDETGWCFAAGDDLALVRAIRDMRDAGESARDRTLAARELVVREFNARTLARTRAALLQTVLPG